MATDARFRKITALTLGAAVTALLAAEESVAQTTRSVRSGEWESAENWENSRPPDTGTTAIVVTGITVASGVSARSLTVEEGGTLEIGGEASVRLVLGFKIQEGARITVNSSNPLALVTRTGGNSIGNASIGGCSNGRLEVFRGGVNVGGQLDVGGVTQPCPDDTVGQGILEVNGAEAAVRATRLGVGQPGAGGGAGQIRLLSGTIEVVESTGINNGKVELVGNNALWLGSENSSITDAGKLDILAGARFLVDRRGKYADLRINNGGLVTVDGGGSLLGVPMIDVSAVGKGQLEVTRGGEIRGNELKISSNGIVRISGADSKASFTGYSAADAVNGRSWGILLQGRGAASSRGLLEILGGAAVTVTASDGVYLSGGRLRVQTLPGTLGDASLPAGLPHSTLMVSGPIEMQDQAFIEIGNGGRMQSGSALLGDLSSVHLRGEGSEWYIAGTLAMHGGQTSTLGIVAGARLTADRIELVNTSTRNDHPQRIVIGRGPDMLGLGAPGVIDVADAIVFGHEGELHFSHTGTDYRFGETLRSEAAGNGLIVHDLGTSIYTGDASGFGGTARISGGSLAINGTLGASRVTVSGGVLAGEGQIAGEVQVQGGTLRGGPGTLRMGALTLNSASTIEVNLSGRDANNPFFSVGGATNQRLVLDGRLDILANGPFLTGAYRLIDYRGTLTDNGLQIGTVPNGSAASDFSILKTADRVMLIAGGGGAPADPFAFWHGGGGTVRIGGAGFVDATGNAARLTAGQFLVFLGGGGTLVVDDDGGPVQVAGLQFAVNGYAMAGDALAISDTATPFRVGDGTSAGAAMVARIGAAVTGAGGLMKTDSGMLILTGTNSFAGGTRIEGGTLSISNDANLGAQAGGLTLAGGTLAATASLSSARAVTIENGGFDVTAGATLALTGALGGSGGLTKTGAGTLVVAGTGSFAGSVVIAGGRFSVNGTLDSMAEVRAGGILGGSGRLGGATIRAGATLAPGNSIGTLQMNGGVLFEPGSVFEVEVDAAGMGDKLTTTGVATLQGGKVSVLATNGNYKPFTIYEILKANDGVSGTFADVTSNLAFLTPLLSYDANSVSLTLSRNDLRFAGAGVTANQIATGNAIDNSFKIGTPLHDHLVTATLTEARAIFDALSGEIHPAALALAAEEAAALRRTLAARAEAAPGAGVVQLWGQAAGTWIDRHGDGNAAANDASGYRLTLGAEIGISDQVTLGVAGGTSQIDLRIDRRASRADLGGLFGALYGNGHFGPLRLRAGVSYGDHDIDTLRDTGAPVPGDRLRASYGASTAQTWGEVGYAFTLAFASLEPFVGIAGLWVREQDFVENGGSVALAGKGRRRTFASSLLGLKAGFGGRDASVRGYARLSWEHGLGKMSMASKLRFASGGDTFTVTAAPFARDDAVIGAGLAWRLAPALTIGLDYAGLLSDRGERHDARISATLRF